MGGCGRGHGDLHARTDARITVVPADFAEDVTLPAVDGILLANALHFVPAARQLDVLTRLARYVRARGRIAVVEYENRTPSQWVPYPLSFHGLTTLAQDAGFSSLKRIGTMPSAYGGMIYAACVEVMS